MDACTLLDSSAHLYNAQVVNVLVWSKATEIWWVFCLGAYMRSGHIQLTAWLLNREIPRSIHQRWHVRHHVDGNSLWFTQSHATCNERWDYCLLTYCGRPLQDIVSFYSTKLYNWTKYRFPLIFIYFMLRVKAITSKKPGRTNMNLPLTRTKGEQAFTFTQTMPWSMWTYGSHQTRPTLIRTQAG